jgi:polyisoprenyl-phosphate glycosyltransferase
MGIAEFHRRASDVARDTCSEDYEIVLIDDGSSDSTWSAIEQLAAADPHVIAVKMSRNFGHQLALSAGLTLVTGSHVFVLDADLQDPPGLLPEMLRKMQLEKADVVYGRRQRRARESAFKRLTAHAFYRLMSWIAEVSIPLDAGDFRLMTRRVSDALCAMPERDRFVRGMVAWVGFKQVPFLYDREGRYAGETSYPLRKMIRLAIDAAVGFSIMPLRLSAFGALLLSFLLLLLMCYTLYAWLFASTVPGWTSTTMIILFVSIIQLVTLSVMGEYVGRTYLQSKNRPLFFIEEVRGTEALADERASVTEA